MERGECRREINMILNLIVFPFLRFRQECKDAGKKLMVWTVNKPEHMMEVRMSLSLSPTILYEFFDKS